MSDKSMDEIIHRISLEYSPPPSNGKPKWAVKWDNWMVNDGRKIVKFVVWFGIQIIYFVISYQQLWEANDFRKIRVLFNVGFPFARAAANLINLNSAAAILTTSRNLITFLRSFKIFNKILPLDSNAEMHIVTVGGIYFWTLVHVVAHSFNYVKISNWAQMSLFELFLKMPTGNTGVMLMVVLLVMAVFSMPNVRRKHFNAFKFAHYLFLCFILLSSIHGAFCFIKHDAEINHARKWENFSNYSICSKSPSFWKWICAPLSVYILEKLIRVWRGLRKVEIKKVIQHPSNTFEIQVSKVGRLKPGQYAFISCPQIGAMEWHPFTASSSPLDDHLSFHIRVVGDWTDKFAKCLGCDFANNNFGTYHRIKKLPAIKIDGFYGAPAEDVFQYDISILIGAGIGVTPFASILKEIWNRYRSGDNKNHIPKKVYFMWICKETQAFEWFQSLLVRLEEDGVGKVVEILIYLTQQLSVNQIKSISLNRNLKRDVITGLESRTQFGRPKLDDFFKKVSKSHPGSDIGVFCCGPPALSGQVGRYCSQYTHSVANGIRFHYGKENF